MQLPHDESRGTGLQMTSVDLHRQRSLASDSLDKYLAAPMQTIPGTKMTYAGLKDAAQRKEMIEYLKGL